MIIVGLILWNPDVEQNIADGDALAHVADVPPQARPASPKEYARSIAELGTQRLAKRITLLTKIHFRGDCVWWHDGRHEQWAYIPAEGESWAVMWQKLARAIVDKKAHIMAHPGDEALLKTFPDMATPFDALPSGWTILDAPLVPPAAPIMPELSGT